MRALPVEYMLSDDVSKIVIVIVLLMTEDNMIYLMLVTFTAVEILSEHREFRKGLGFLKII